MSSTNQVGKKLTVDAQTDNQRDADAAVDECERLAPTVELETQATIDFDTSLGERESRFFGQTLAEEERIRAEEAELERYSERAREREAYGLDEERMNRAAAARVGEAETEAFEQAVCEGAVGRDVCESDPRKGLGREQLAAVNEYAERIADEVTNAPSAAAVSRRLAERVEAASSFTTAVIETKEAIQQDAGVIQPIASIDSWHYEADIEATVDTLWTPASSTQQQVGLLRDETGTVKLTIWKKSDVSVVLHEGDKVQVRAAKVGCYNGQVTLAADSKTVVERVEEGDGPAPRQ